MAYICKKLQVVWQSHLGHRTLERTAWWCILQRSGHWLSPCKAWLSSILPTVGWMPRMGRMWCECKHSLRLLFWSTVQARHSSKPLSWSRFRSPPRWQVPGWLSRHFLRPRQVTQIFQIQSCSRSSHWTQMPGPLWLWALWTLQSQAPSAPLSCCCHLWQQGNIL